MKIPPRLLRRIHDFLLGLLDPEAGKLLRDLDRYVTRRRVLRTQPTPVDTGQANTAAVRSACLERAGGRCECGCSRPFLWPSEMDHFYGKKFTSVEECWILRRDCHEEKTQNLPTRASWDIKFKAHCVRYGYRFRHRLTKDLPRKVRRA